MRVLCITGYSDRPEAETFIGLKNSWGFNMHILCPESAPHFRRLIEAGVRVTPFDLKKRVDWNGIRQIRAIILENKISVLHLFNNKAVFQSTVMDDISKPQSESHYMRGRSCKKILSGNEAFMVSNPKKQARYNI